METVPSHVVPSRLVPSRRPPDPSRPATEEVSREVFFAGSEPTIARPAETVTPPIPEISETLAAPALPAALEIPGAEILPGRRLVPRSTLLAEEPPPGSPGDDPSHAETRMELRLEKAAPAEPVIRVTIGRIEVRATAPAPPPAPAARPSAPRLTLEEYLRQRGEGRM